MRHLAHILVLQLITLGFGQKTKGAFNMGCDCGKREVDEHEEKDCEVTQKMEAPSQEQNISLQAFDHCCAGMLPFLIFRFLPFEINHLPSK